MALGLIAYGGLRKRRHPRLSAKATASALQARLKTSYGFSCTREENDGTIGLRDVDYFCQPDRVSGDASWVGTDDREITGIQVAS